MRADLWDSAAAARRVRRVTSRKTPAVQAVPSPETAAAAAAAAFLDGQEITTTQCAGCGREINGIKGRYSCACGWVNPWYDGHGELPAAEEDPDWPGHG